jgi:hypothetical protein
MSHRIDLVDQRFDRLTVMAFAWVDAYGNTCWRVQCDCGSNGVVRASCLRRGDSRSCGCLFTENIRGGLLKHGYARTYSRDPLYDCWAHLIQRCENPKNPGFKHYGGRGITVCERWRLSFLDFLADMGPRPSPQHSLDRINNDGNYEPGNCRWATAAEQRRNQRPRARAA